MRTRVRPAYTPEQMPGIYPKHHEHHEHADHVLRVKRSIAVAEELYPGPRNVVADLACGDAAIAKALNARVTLLGDYCEGYPIRGMIEDTITAVGHADLFIFTEVMEHLDDPDAMLKEIRRRADLLLCSTPLNEAGYREVHGEHYWSWTDEDVFEMLTAAGWDPVFYEAVNFPGFAQMPPFQIWGCT